jgi:aspartyl-tRNA(Asn)/glutamyl-tRNA(Gln) amidotransferase subunit C
MFRMPSDPKAAFLSPSGIERIASLARLRLDPAEFATLGPQLRDILGHIEKIAEIPETELADAPAAPATPLREDRPLRGDGRTELEDNARATAHGHVPVPRVVDSAR